MDKLDVRVEIGLPVGLVLALLALVLDPHRGSNLLVPGDLLIDHQALGLYHLIRNCQKTFLYKKN